MEQKTIVSLLNSRYTPYFLLAAVALFFSASLPFAFLRSMDDWAYITGNPNFGWSFAQCKALVSEPVLGLYTPLPQATYLIDFALGGLENPFFYRLQNILWHMGAVLLALRFFRELGLCRETAFWCALIFAIHPQRIESVVWVSERKDVMLAFFFLLSMVCYLSVRRRGKTFSWGTLLAMVAAMLCKPSAMLLPGVLFFIELGRSRSWNWREALRANWIYAIASAGYLLWNSRLSSGTADLVREQGISLLLPLLNYAGYWYKTFLPATLYPIYPDMIYAPADFLISGLLLLFLVATWYKKRTLFFRHILPLMLAAGLILLPTSGIIAFSNAEFADRYSYLPSLFFLASLGFIAGGMNRQKRLVACVLVAAVAIRFFTYLPAWNGDEAVLEAATACERPNFRASVAYAGLLAAKGEFAEARIQLDRTETRGARATSHAPFIAIHKEFLRLIELAHSDTPGKALPELRSMAFSPEVRLQVWAPYQTNRQTLFTSLARAELATGSPDRAARCYETLAGELADEPFHRHFFTGIARMLQKNYREAVSEFDAALKLRPHDKNAKANLHAAKLRCQ